MSEETTRRALQPPVITDASDDDTPDEVLSLLGKDKVSWPPKDMNADALNVLTMYGLKLSRNKVMKAIGLAIVAGVSAIAYTYILLSVR